METEYFDVLDKNMQKMGIKSRTEVHEKGLWHQTFNCWIVERTSDEQVRLLFQLRHKDKDICPSLLDISCAGHLQSGEQVEDGLRELEEELGIIAPFDDLLYCGMVAQENQYHEHLIDREFNHIFLYENAEHKELAGYQFQLSEISGLFWIDFKEFEELVNGNIDRVQAEGIIVNETEGIIEDSMKTCSIADFTPKSDIYYTLLFKKIIEFIKTDH